MNYLEYTEEYWAFDLETDLIPATKVYCCSFVNIVTGEEHLKLGPQEIKTFIVSRPNAVWVGHNAISFDAYIARTIIGCAVSNVNCIDTLILSKLYDTKIEGGHSLKSWGIRLKMPKDEHNDFSKYTPEMGKYCLQDARIAAKLYKKIVQRLINLKVSNLCITIEHQIREVLDQQQRNGFAFNVSKAKQLRAELDKKARVHEDKIHEVFPPLLVEVARYKFRLKKNGEPVHHYLNHKAKYPKIEFIGNEYACFDYKPFNIGSVQQRIEKLLSVGWEPTEFTDKGNPKIDEEALLKFAEESGSKEAGYIAEWLVLTGRSSMISTWLNNCDPDGFIRGTVDTLGASTRRMTHSAPNTANIPGLDVLYGHESRNMWEAREGRVLVGVDAKAGEMRMFGHYLNNDEAAKMYIEGDPHTFNAELLEIPRKPMKSVFYAFLYGASDTKLGKTAGQPKPAKWGKEARAKLIERTPGLLELVKTVQREQETGIISTIDGGFVRCSSSHAALNYKLQSALSICMKLMCISLVNKINELGLDALVVGNIHDELQLDCSTTDAEKVGELALEVFLETGKQLGLRVPLEGDYKIGRTWAETH